MILNEKAVNYKTVNPIRYRNFCLGHHSNLRSFKNINIYKKLTLSSNYENLK